MANDKNEKLMMMLCAHVGCRCVINAELGVIIEKALYCSQECSEGKSCGHNLCNCADVNG